MVFNNDCQYYSTLQNLVDMLSFSDLIKNSIHNNKKQRVNYQIQPNMWFFYSKVHKFQKISIPVPQLQPFSHNTHVD